MSDDEPACWSWTVPSYDPVTMPLYFAMTEAEAVFAALHRERCAICGFEPFNGLVEDHDHATGMIRGLLCRSCNVREGRSNEPVFIRYRRIHPAQMMDIYLPYTGIHWVMGWWEGDCPGDPYELGPRPPTPWKPWTKDVPLNQPCPEVGAVN